MAEMPPEHVKLVKKAMRGNAKATKALYELYTGLVYNLARHTLVNTADAEDVTQDVAIKVMRSIKGLHDPRAFRGWIYRITVLTCYDYNRKQARIKTERIGESDIVDSLAETDVGSLPEESLDVQEIHEAASAIVDSLPNSQREAIYLRYYADLSYEEIAKALNISTATVGTNIMKGKKKIKEKLTKMDEQGNAFDFDAYNSAPANDVPSDAVIAGIFAADSDHAMAQPAFIHTKVAVSAVLGNLNTAVSAIAKNVAAIVGILGVSGVILLGTYSYMKSIPAAQPVSTPAATQPASFKPDASIIFSSKANAGDAGSICYNPSSARISTNEGTPGTWRVVSPGANAALLSGAGNPAASDFAKLANGTYQLQWYVVNENGLTATVEREFIISY
jgi:RNA polymerase sigma-70 factor (ECF subfamily)